MSARQLVSVYKHGHPDRDPVLIRAAEDLAKLVRTGDASQNLISAVNHAMDCRRIGVPPAKWAFDVLIKELYMVQRTVWDPKLNQRKD